MLSVSATHLHFSAKSSHRKPSLTRYAFPWVALLVVGPSLTLGGAPAWCVPLWATTALVALALAGCDPASVRKDPLLWAGGLVIVVATIQILPLPPWLLGLIDPRSAELSAHALAPFRVDLHATWRPLHLDPGNGYADLQYFIGLGAAYLAAKRLTHRGFLKQIYRALCGAALTVTLLFLAHQLLGLEKVYGFYTPRAAGLQISPLLNSNHLAALTGAGAILWAGQALEAESLVQRSAMILGAVLCGTVCALTLSRGGVAAALGGLVLLALMVLFRRNVPPRTLRTYLLAVPTLSLVVLGGAWAAWSELRTEYASDDLTKLDFISSSLRPLGRHLALGVGSGGLHAAVATEQALPGYISMTRAECILVDLATAFGPWVTLTILALGAWWFWTLRPRSSATLQQTAAFCALASLVVHELLDFALWLGANGYFAAVLAGWLAGTRMQQRSEPRARSWPAFRPTVMVATVASMAAGMVTAHSTLGLDRDRLQTAVTTQRRLPEAQLRAALLRHPADAYLPVAQASLGLLNGDSRALRFVARAMELSPGWSYPHVMLAQILFAHGLTPQGLLEVHYAAGLSTGYHDLLSRLVDRLKPDAETLAHTVPEGPIGLSFLQTLGSIASMPFSERVDALLLKRMPNHIEALNREALRAGAAGQRDRQRSLYEQIIHLWPESPMGYLGMTQLQIASQDLTGAEALLRHGMAQSKDPVPFLERIAEVQYHRHDGASMRRTVQQMLDETGADIGQRIRLYGQLGSWEGLLGNDALALIAFERANAMAFPEHPYLSQIVIHASRLNDLPRLRSACELLSDVGPLDANSRAFCGVTEQASSALVQAFPVSHLVAATADASVTP